MTPASSGSGRFNATMRKFGAPDTLVRDYRGWIVLLRPRQATLGALVLAAYDPVKSFSEISEQAFGELKQVTAELETALQAAFGYDRINYLMLMMVDPDVHFHVLPRYAQERQFEGRGFADPGWPGPPDLAHGTDTGPELNQAIAQRIRECWP